MDLRFTKTRRVLGALASISIVSLLLMPVPAHSSNPVPKSARKRIAVSDAVVLDWVEIARTKIFPNGPPFEAARRMAMVQAAVFEAVNAVTGKYEPYLGTVSAPEGASPEAAAIMASWSVLNGFNAVPDAGLDASRDASLGAIPDGKAKTDGIAVGLAAADAVRADRTGDGSSPPLFHPPVSFDPYEWRPTPTCPVTGTPPVPQGAFRHWPNMKPFAIESPVDFRAEPPPELNSGVYAQDFNELQRVGASNASLDARPQDRTDVARLYAATPGHWLWSWALVQIARTRNDEITKTARTAALMNMAINDAYMTGFESKYYYRTWRPETAIPRGDEDGNAWTTAGPFTPLVLTPCFPGYPSNHGIGSGAARTVLVRAYGRFGHEITMSHANAAGIVFSYSDLKVLTDDIADARVYGGIHFRYDQDSGEKQGHRIGQYVYNNTLKKVDDE